MRDTHYLDGPAEGIRIELSRAPEYLRVAVGDVGISPLARLTDKPDEGEDVVVYRRLGATPDGTGVGYATDEDFPPTDLHDNAAWRTAVESVIAERNTA